MTFDEWRDSGGAPVFESQTEMDRAKRTWDASEKAATAAEREACAVTVEKTLLPQNITDAIAALIRARSDD
ncbi:hypothetical protein LCGC14_1464170 [marine sediment metagenome]|uniref:Uncharacterized protein n=1 Tax=marine sediment metagenome TaxID=412755 RepID=A0A0F9JEP4_9ZZZZ